ncbi:MAG: S1 RNA-binding domain-containing protein [Candidatus Nanoarchaeia archaeon]
MYKKEDLPEKDDLVICTIREATPSSVFVVLDEFEKAEGMIHVSEITRKQVRAMKVYLKPGTKLVCKVMEVDAEKRFLTLSLRRVGEGQRRAKLQEWDKEKTAYNILEVFAKQANLSAKDMKDIIKKIIKKYGLLYSAFLQTAQNGKNILIEAGIDENLATSLTSLIQKRIVLPKCRARGFLVLQSLAPDGLTRLKKGFDALTNSAKRLNLDLTITYISAPQYQFVVESTNKKTIDAWLKEIPNIFQKDLGKEAKIEVKIQE